MDILANAYFDVVAATRGLVVLFFCILIVLLCEYEVYRILSQKHGRVRSVITCVYSNIVSWALGLFLVNDKILDFFERISFELFGKENDISEDYALLVFCFFMTWFIEAIAINFFRRKLHIQKILLGAGLANLVSYVVLAITLFVFLGN